MKNFVWMIVMAIFISGCFTTRSQLKEQSTLQTQVSSIQQAKADTDTRLEDFENQLRQFNGRIEVLENDSRYFREAIAKNEEKKKLDDELLENKFKVIQDALLKIEAELQKMSVEIEGLKAKKSSKSSTTNATKGNYQQAEIDFGNKKWKQAAVNYQKYRDLNPKGKYYAEASYKIGVCFQEMGMKTEAKAFYQEVLDKFPKSRTASKAEYRLKNIK